MTPPQRHSFQFELPSKDSISEEKKGLCGRYLHFGGGSILTPPVISSSKLLSRAL